jgi:selenocysteine lyase/cysteine desulfurase
MWRFFEGVQAIPGVTVYGDIASGERIPRSAIVALNIRDYDSAAVSDDLAERFGIATRPGAHCAPLMHEALGTVQQGMVRFSFGWFNTAEEIDAAIEAVAEIAR